MNKRKPLKYETFSDELKTFIRETYTKEYSVTQVVIQIKTNLNINNLGRKPVEDYLKSINIYEGASGVNYMKNKVMKNENIMMEKYGVKNWSNLEGNGWSKINNIPYTKKVKYLTDDFKVYQQEVSKLTKKIISKMTKPIYCEYTGILFADEEVDKVNPNDARKRTVDHKMPVLICYLNGLDVGTTCNKDNLMFVLRCVNTTKSNTTYESFLPIAKTIRKVYIDEGFKSN